MTKTIVKPRIISVIFFLLLLNLIPAGAQTVQGDTAQTSSLSEFILEKHGFDSELINGIQYHYPYAQTRSDPYFGRTNSFPGSVVLSGIRYKNISLQYDIYAQQLALEYNREPLGFTKVLLSPLFTDAFEMEGNSFEKISLDENGPLFYQLIQAQGLTCYIHWKKKKLGTSDDTKYLYYFTKPIRTYFLDYKGRLSPFSSRRDLASLFGGEEKKSILKYMRMNGLRMNEITISELNQLMKFIVSETGEIEQN